MQVNPYEYIRYRGTEHQFSEEDYNQAIYENCVKIGVKIVGLADHGNVESSKSLREYLKAKGIVVFPGFEISTSERIHIVCLFDESTTKAQLERYLGGLDLTDTSDGISPSKLSFNQIAAKIEECNCFWYAAHITQDNGVLKNQQYRIWQSKYLVAAQIPAKRSEVEDKYINIIKNKNPNFDFIPSCAVITMGLPYLLIILNCLCEVTVFLVSPRYFYYIFPLLLILLVFLTFL